MTWPLTVRVIAGDFAGVTGPARTFTENGKGLRALLLSGGPIDEPIVGQGPFVMNTPQEIRQAMADDRSGRMGHLF